MKECKYRLPCNWCDKHNKYCDMVEPITIDLSNIDKCNHIWEVEKKYIYPPESKNVEPYCIVKRVCCKCHASELLKTDINGNIL